MREATPVQLRPIIGAATALVSVQLASWLGPAPPVWMPRE